MSSKILYTLILLSMISYSAFADIEVTDRSDIYIQHDDSVVWNKTLSFCLEVAPHMEAQKACYSLINRHAPDPSLAKDNLKVLKNEKNYEIFLTFNNKLKGHKGSENIATSLLENRMSEKGVSLLKKYSGGNLGFNQIAVRYSSIGGKVTGHESLPNEEADRHFVTHLLLKRFKYSPASTVFIFGTLTPRVLRNGAIVARSINFESLIYTDGTYSDLSSEIDSFIKKVVEPIITEPIPQEIEIATSHIKKHANDPKRTYEDIVWTLINNEE